MKKEQLVVALADLHCGHVGGLTPPSWQFREDSHDPRVRGWALIQRELWNTYAELARQYQTPDLLIVNGDLIDGRGEATGGTELVTADLETQTRMAAEALALFAPRKVIAAYGTPYHAGHAGQDWEKLVMNFLVGMGIDAEIHSHPFVRVEDIIFDIRHFGGRAELPYTKGTPLGKAWLSNMLWAFRQGQPQADIILRAHIHSAFFSGAFWPDWIGFFQPALQAAVTKWGGRISSTVVDWGILVFHICGARYTWEAHIEPLQANQTTYIELGAPSTQPQLKGRQCLPEKEDVGKAVGEAPRPNKGL